MKKVFEKWATLLGAFIFGVVIYNIPSTAWAQNTQPYSEKSFSLGEEKELVYDLANNLRMKIISPAGVSANDQPTVVLFHGGGWQVNGGDKFDGTGYSLGKEMLVKRGYTLITVEYRLMPKMDGCNVNGAFKNSLRGLPKSPYGRSIPNQVGFGVEVYRAALDSRNAIKYIFDNSSSLGVDRRNVFLLGQSAGAFNVLHSMFIDDQEMKPYQVAVETEGVLQPKQNVRGVVAMSGGVFDLNFINSSDETSLLMTYFSTDLVVASNSQKVLPLCAIPTLFDPLPLTHGSDSIIGRMRKLGMQNFEFYRVNGVGHVGSSTQENAKIEQRIVKYLGSRIVP